MGYIRKWWNTKVYRLQKRRKIGGGRITHATMQTAFADNILLVHSTLFKMGLATEEDMEELARASVADAWRRILSIGYSAAAKY